MPAEADGGYSTSTFGFAVCGLNRLLLETAAENLAMIRAAEHAGFNHEGVLRQATWVMSTFTDSTVMGLLAAD